MQDDKSTLVIMDNLTTSLSGIIVADVSEPDVNIVSASLNSKGSVYLNQIEEASFTSGSTARTLVPYLQASSDSA